MSTHLRAIQAEGEIDGKRKKHILLWEKGNIPSENMLLWWFRRYFEGRKWKLIGNKQFHRSDDYEKL